MGETRGKVNRPPPAVGCVERTSVPSIIHFVWTARFLVQSARQAIM